MSEPLLGYARDWDLFAPAGVVFMTTALAGVLWFSREARTRLGTLRTISMVSGLHLALWVSFNHSERLAAQRFETLPLGLGRTEVVLGNWHMRNERSEEAEAWFLRAIEDHPYNANAYGLLGALYVRQGKFDLAALAYEEALQTRPDKVPYRSSLVGALMALDRWEEARPHLETLRRQDPSNPRYARALVQVHARAGREPERQASLQAAADLYAARLEDDPTDLSSVLDYGVLLAENGRPESALTLFRRALELEPRSDAALFNAAGVLIQLERAAEATPYLRRLLELYPDHPRAGLARRWLEAAG